MKRTGFEFLNKYKQYNKIYFVYITIIIIIRAVNILNNSYTNNN